MKAYTLLTLCFLLLGLYSSYAQDPTVVTPNYSDKLLLINDRNTKFYKVLIQNLPGGSHLSISLRSGDNTAPVLYYKDPENPAGDNSMSGGIIWVPHSTLLKHSEITFSLVCQRDQCTADLVIEYANEIYATTDGLTHRYSAAELGNASSTVIRLHVPDTPNADRIVIHAEAIPRDYDTPPSMELLINKGDRIPDTSTSDLVPRSAWFEGRTAVIYKGTELFELNEIYTLSLRFTPGSQVSFQAYVQESTTNLLAFYRMDAVQQGRTNMYTYELLDKMVNEDILFDISPQNGAVDVDITCQSSPDAHWHFKIDKKREDIILTPQEHAICNNKTYNIAVTSNETSVYNIRALAREEDNLYLLVNQPTVGTIQPHETVEYELSIPIYTMEKVEIWLNTTGKVNLSVINCRFSNDCPGFSPENIRHPDVGGTLQEFTYEKKVYENQGQVIIIDPHRGGCYPIMIDLFFLHAEPMPVCAYKINITSEDSNPVDYSLETVSEGHEILLLSNPSSGIVSTDETEFFVLHVPDDNIKSVSFQLTVFSGHAEIYVSRTEKFPTKNLGEAQLQHEGFILFQNISNLSGTYYVGVKGLETSSFSVAATAIDINGVSEDDAILLKEGTPTRGVLFPKNEYPSQHYKLDINLDDDFEGVIKITSLSLQGKVVLTASTETISPSSLITTWSSQTGSLEINSTESRFIKKGTYYIGVFVNWDDPSAYAFEQLTFLISYHILHKDSAELANKQHVILTTFFPFHAVIQPEQTLYFKVYILPGEQKITVFKQADAGDVDIYLSTSTHNLYPDAENYNISTKDSHQNHISLNTTDFEDACKDKTSYLLCEFNFAVTTASTKEVSFTLSLERGERGATAIALEDGKQSMFGLPAENKSATFYFYPSPQKDAFIEISCPRKEIEIYAYRRTVVTQNSDAPKEIPSPEDYDFYSGAGSDLELGFARIMIPGSSESNSTIVTIAVYFKDGYSTAKSLDKNKPKTFTIVASSHIVELYMGKPISSYVTKDSYQYYFFNVHRKECNLLISLTTLDDGDSDLLVSQGWLARPTLDDHMLASISPQGTELIKVTPLDIYPKKSMEGLWVVGVYGRSNSRFTLTVVYEDMSVIELHQGVPTELYLAADSKIHFKYTHQTEKDFDIVIDKISGNLIGYVKVLPAGEDMQSNLPSADSKTWTINPERDPAFRIKGDACLNCMYLITLEIYQSSKFLITVIEEENTIRIQNSVIYQATLFPNEKKKYMFFAKNYEQIDVGVTLKSGSFGVYVTNNPTVNATNYIFGRNLTLDTPSFQQQIGKDVFNQVPMVVWNGETDIPSSHNTFFFSFENNGASEAKYSFSVSLKEGSTILILGVPQDFGFDGLQEKSFMYYSPHITGVTTLTLSYCILTIKPDDSKQRDTIYSELLEGFGIEIMFWDQKVTAGVGEEITELKNDILIDTMTNRDDLMDVCLKQTIVIENQQVAGRYEISFKNTYAGSVLLNLLVDTTEVNYKVFHGNRQYLESLSIDEVKDFEVIMPDKGVWYLNVFSCQGKLKVIVGDTPEAIDAQESYAGSITALDYPKQYHYHVPIESAGTKYVRVKGVNVENDNQTSIDFVVMANFFKDDQVNGYTSLTPKSRGLYNPIVGHTYNYDGDNSLFTLNFTPISFTDTSPNDQLYFFIGLCPEETAKKIQTYCLPYYRSDDCYYFPRVVPIDTTSMLSQAFPNIPPGKYEAKIVGSVVHHEEVTVPFAYKSYEVELKEPVYNKMMDSIYIILIGLAVVVGALILYRTVRRVSAGRKASSARNYEFVQEELE